MSEHIFGPVPSRRLGRSLGVDLVPFKTCTYDCIYCQLGRTTCKTVERKEWVPLDEILAGLDEKLRLRPDYVTLSGSGEPTLYSPLGGLIDRIKATTDVPVAVLTNGSLLWREDVREELLGADLVIPSLDAGRQATFRAVNRPHDEITFHRMLDGLIEFRRQFRGKYWLEVFLLADYNATEDEIADLARAVDRIGPDRVQLNTVSRPPAERFAEAVPAELLTELAGMFRPAAEVIADFRGVHQQAEFVPRREEVLALLQRRPCSVEDIARGLSVHRNEVVKHLEQLAAEGLVRPRSNSNKRFYEAVHGDRAQAHIGAAEE
jgi:wyosine [tRNA(Phe)-imidazoG37] synthetase (radical SAM superfamily)